MDAFLQYVERQQQVGSDESVSLVIPWRWDGAGWQHDSSIAEIDGLGKTSAGCRGYAVALLVVCAAANSVAGWAEALHACEHMLAFSPVGCWDHWAHT